MPVDKVPSWIKQVLIPEFNEIKGKLESINPRIDSTNERIDSLKNEMNVRFDSLEKRIPVIEEITALKIKIADLEKRLAMV